MYDDKAFLIERDINSIDCSKTRFQLRRREDVFAVAMLGLKQVKRARVPEGSRSGLCANFLQQEMDISRDILVEEMLLYTSI